jgi:hypothetical protein
MDENLPLTNNGGSCVDLISSLASLDRTFVHLCYIMQEIMDEHTLRRVTISNHANSLLIVIALTSKTFKIEVTSCK